MMDILLEAGDDAPNVLFVGLVQTQEDLDLAFASADLRRPSPMRRRWPRTGRSPRSASSAPTPGPRSTCAASSASGAVVTLEEGIRRLTSMPARRVGLAGRGELVPGAWADVTVFDPETIADRGTVEAPNAFATGVRDVFVNGRGRDARRRLRRRGGRRRPAPLGARGGGMIYLKGVQR